MFTGARLKLTLWYVLILSLISAAFSVVIYDLMTTEVDRFAQQQQFRLERRLRDGTLIPLSFPNTVTFPFVEPELIMEIKKRLLIALLGVDGCIILVSSGLAYFLAGRTLRPIQIMVQEQNRFISDASHELKTPLTSLKSAFEVFIRDKDPSLAEAKVLVEESIDEVNKLQSLSESLLELAQYGTSTAHTKIERISLKKIVQQATRTLNPLAIERDIKLVIGDEDVQVNANKYGLAEVMTILVDNAIKYSEPGGTVEISFRKKGTEAIITVKDSGAGILKKDLPHIFDRFYRSDTARSKVQVSGYGLGLSIAKKIIENHQGYIVVESKIKEGTQFFVHLPLKPSIS